MKKLIDRIRRLTLREKLFIAFALFLILAITLKWSSVRSGAEDGIQKYSISNWKDKTKKR